MVTEDREMIEQFHSINEFPEQPKMSVSGGASSLWMSRE